jgi:hypothetical protein
MLLRHSIVGLEEAYFFVLGELGLPSDGWQALGRRRRLKR